jgi:hypothetical protein
MTLGLVALFWPIIQAGLGRLRTGMNRLHEAK